MTGKTSKVSDKIHQIISQIHRAFMQPKNEEENKSLRKQYWQEAWNDIRTLDPEELEELSDGLKIVIKTLRKLGRKVEELRDKRVRATSKSNTLMDMNQWEEDDFLSSSDKLPVF